jgi:enterochelin esterase-like enzyme
VNREVQDVEKYSEMVVTELIPLIDERYRTVPDPMGRASVGASSGANAALFSTFKHPDLFGRVGSQSATFDAKEIEEMIGNADEQPLVVYMDWGTYHMRSPHEAWDLAEESRKAWALLRERGYRPAGGEVPEGFGWACWRGHTDELLAALFPLRRGPA